MTTNLHTIINELVALDPTFAAHRGELERLVKKLLATQPNVTCDAAFAARLKEELLARLATRPTTLSERLRALFATSEFRYAGIGALATAIIVAPLAYVVLTHDRADMPAFVAETTTHGIRIAKLPANAFGSLTNVTPGSGGGTTQALSARANTAVPAMISATATANDIATTAVASEAVMGDTSVRSLSATNEAMPVAAPMPANAGAVAVEAPAEKRLIAPGESMPPYEYTKYVYAYDGALPDISTNIAVLKRDTTLPIPTGLTQTFKNGLVDIAKLKDTKLQNVSLIEDREYGYAVNLDWQNGTVNLNQNWQRWPHPEDKCIDDACRQNARIKISEIPSEKELVTIADRFLADYGVSREGYGTPRVDWNWKRDYDAQSEEQKQNYWLPSDISVVYPVVIDGREVREEWSALSGLTVSVNVRAKRVAGVWNLASQSYASSDYAAAAADLLKKAIEAGGQASWQPENTKIKTVTLSLAAPKEALVKYWIWDTKTNTSSELLIPSLVFPVETPKDPGYYGQQEIVIPLAADILKNRITPPNGQAFYEKALSSRMPLTSSIAPAVNLTAPASEPAIEEVEK